MEEKAELTAMIARLRRLRFEIFRPGTKSDRCLVLFSRFIKTARSAGTRVALRKVGERLTRKLNRYRLVQSRHPERGFSPASFRGTALSIDSASCHGSSGGRTLVGRRQRRAATSRSCWCRIPQAARVLRCACSDWWKNSRDGRTVECWVVLQQGGELADSFANLVPTLEVEWLAARGVDRRDAPRVIASAFHEFSSRGVAVCNTLAVSDFHTAFAEMKVEVLSWIHELPTFITLLGGERAIEAIKRASRKLMVPSQAVRNALVTHFEIDPVLIRTVYNGQDPRTRGLDREALRIQVRRELGLPEHAKIVLGCGTVDLRKGADLFVNVARRVLLGPEHTVEKPDTYFIWVGHPIYENIERWVLHDAAIGGLGERIRFVGARDSMAHYYMAADCFGAHITRRSLPAREHGGDGKRPASCRLRRRRRRPRSAPRCGRLC